MTIRKQTAAINKPDIREDQKGIHAIHTIHILAAVFTLGVMTLLGCSQKEVLYNNLDLVRVSGKVTLENKPLANAQILFYDEAKSYSYGVTDENGKYCLKFNSKVNGTRPGKKRVEIWTTRKGADFDLLMTESYPQNEVIPAKYNKNTALQAEVTQESHSFDFQLDSQGIKTTYFNPDEQTE